MAGIALGLVVAVFIILRNNFKVPYRLQKQNVDGKEKVRMVLSEDVTFLNKASIKNSLADIPDDTYVEIDESENRFIHHDVAEIIEDFKISAPARNITVAMIYADSDEPVISVPNYELID